MKKYLSILMIVTLALFTACNDDDSPNNNEEEQNNNQNNNNGNNNNNTTAQISWVKRANCPISMSNYVSYAIGNDIYYINEDGNMLAYNIPTDKWSQKAVAPSNTYQNLSFSLNGKIYIWGILYGEENSIFFYEYTVDTDTWEKSEVPVSPNSVPDGFHYFQVDGKVGNYQYLYNPDKNEWETLDEFKINGQIEKRNTYEINKKAYSIMNNGFFEFNPSTTKKWVLKYDFVNEFGVGVGVPRTNKPHITFSYNNKVYIYFTQGYALEKLLAFDVEKNETEYVTCTFPVSGENLTTSSTINVNGRVFLGPVNASYWELSYK